MPNSIQVIPWQGTSIRPINNSIWVEHGDELEYKVISQGLSFWMFATYKNGIPHKESDHPLTYKRTRRLTWMHSSSYENHSLFLSVLRIRDCHHIDVISWIWQNIPPGETAIFLLFAQGLSSIVLQEMLQHWISIRVAISKINLVITFLEIVAET